VKSRELSDFLSANPDRSVHELVRDILLARADYAKFATYLQEDAVFTFVGHICDLSYSGVYRGREQILDLLRRIDAEVELSDHKILNLIVDGDTFGLRRSTLVRHRGTSATQLLVLGNIVTLRDGKIAEGYEYVDTSWLKKISGEQD
jgi:ketosteroid isomerase-like protein